MIAFYKTGPLALNKPIGEGALRLEISKRKVAV